MKRSDLSETYCPVGRASAEIGIGWTFVILRELAFRNCRFNGLLAQTGMSPRSLSQRLKELETSGVLCRTPDPEDARSALYGLTPKGEALWPILVHLSQWGSEWCGPWEGDAPVVNIHNGHAFKIESRCADCGEPVTSAEVQTEFSPRYTAERQKVLNR